MAYVCPCGDDELVVRVNETTLTTYCQSCGTETEEPVPEGMSPPRLRDEKIISITRASILKKMNNKPSTQDEKRPKQIKQARDRTNYTPQKGGRR